MNFHKNRHMQLVPRTRKLPAHERPPQDPIQSLALPTPQSNHQHYF